MAAIEHWWQSMKFVNPSGLTKARIAYKTRTFEMEFNILEHQLRLNANVRASHNTRLAQQSVANV